MPNYADCMFHVVNSWLSSDHHLNCQLQVESSTSPLGLSFQMPSYDLCRFVGSAGAASKRHCHDEGADPSYKRLFSFFWRVYVHKNFHGIFEQNWCQSTAGKNPLHSSSLKLVQIMLLKRNSEIIFMCCFLGAIMMVNHPCIDSS